MNELSFWLNNPFIVQSRLLTIYILVTKCILTSLSLDNHNEQHFDIHTLLLKYAFAVTASARQKREA